MLRNVVPALLLAVMCGSPVLGQDWARMMFETTSHDFGSVARGAKAEYEFVLRNIYVEDVHIAGVRSSCGCTTPQIKKPLLKTYEKGAIVAHLNSAKYIGRKGATITVTLDQPFPAEVQLQVTSYIRCDVVLDPGSVEMGSVEHGTGAEKTITVDYAGRDDWEIVDTKSANPHLSGDLREVERGGGRVGYELTVRLDDKTPPGYLRDHLMLVTNDRRLTQVPVLVEGVVQTGITVSPSSLFMGVVEPGEKVTKQLVVRGKKPFRILSVRCDGGCFEFDTSAETAAKPLHVIPVTFAAGAKPGKVLQTIRIETDLGETVPELSAYAVVAP